MDSLTQQVNAQRFFRELLSRQALVFVNCCCSTSIRL